MRGCMQWLIGNALGDFFLAHLDNSIRQVSADTTSNARLRISTQGTTLTNWCVLGWLERGRETT